MEKRPDASRQSKRFRESKDSFILSEATVDGDDHEESDDSSSTTESALHEALAMSKSLYEKNHRIQEQNLKTAHKCASGCLSEYRVFDQSLFCDPGVLELGKWLTTSVIDVFGNALVQEYPQVHYLNIGFLNFAKAKCYPSWLRVLPNGGRFILAPWNMSNAHWTLVVMDCFEKRIILMDSSPGCFDVSQANATLVDLQTHLNNIDSESSTGNSWLLSIHGSFPKQQNGSDCGAFVSYFMRVLATSEKLRHATSKIEDIEGLQSTFRLDIGAFRIHMRDVLSKYKV